MHSKLGQTSVKIAADFLAAMARPRTASEKTSNQFGIPAIMVISISKVHVIISSILADHSGVSVSEIEGSASWGAPQDGHGGIAQAEVD
jgi:hypothetical protein